jgi:hypothetical protein
MSSRTIRIRSEPSMPRSDGSFGVPDLDRPAVDRLHLGLTAQDNDQLCVTDHLRGQFLGHLVTDVGPHFGQGRHGLGVQARSWLGSGRVDLEPCTGRVRGEAAHQPGRHLRLAAVTDADEHYP